MLELGRWQELTVIKNEPHGIYLAENTGSSDKVLLPKKQVPKDIKTGSRLNVFIYLDSKDRIISTVNKPLITLHKVAMLKVKNTSKIGAFVDWGLEKDLLLPFREQTYPVKAGDDVLCALYIDKTRRLCLTMKLYEYLESGSPYKEGDEVNGYVYEISRNFGAFVAVDNKYSALIKNNELYGNIRAGQTGTFRVLSKTEDGRDNLAIRKKAYIQINDDSDTLLSVIKKNGGFIPYNDKTSPEIIRQEFNMSKNEFKRAAGHLYKEKKIKITDDGIHLL